MSKQHGAVSDHVSLCGGWHHKVACVGERSHGKKGRNGQGRVRLDLL